MMSVTNGISSTVASGHGKCVIEVPNSEIELYTWDFEISRRSRLIENLTRLRQACFDFNGLKFTSGTLATLDHSWSVSITPSYCFATTTLYLPEKNWCVGVSVHPCELLFLSNGETKYTESFSFESTTHSSKNSWTSRCRVNERIWDDTIDTLRFILSVKVEPVAKCRSVETDLAKQLAEECRISLSNSNNGEFTRDFFLSEHLSDVKLICGETEIPTHRFLLSCKSPVFKSMFERHEMKEAQEGRVEIKEMDRTSLLNLVKYMYTGEIENISENAVELFKAADRYGVMDLKTKCCSHLLQNVSAENAVESYTLGNTYNDSSLMRISFHYLKHDKKNAFRHSEMFRDFCMNFPEVLFKIFQSS